MKKFLPIFLSIALLFLSGCKADTAKEETADKTINAVASFYPIYILALNVADGVSGVEVKNLMPSQGGCPHDYQLTPEDLKAVDNADVLFTNGAGLEGFLEDITHRYPNLEISETSKSTRLVESEQDLHDADDDLDDHNDEAYNAHVWLSIPNAVKQAENIRDTFIRIDPQNEKQYRENTENFSKQCNELSTQMRGFDLAKRQKAAVFHEGFEYLAQDFGFDVEIGIFADENISPSAKEMAEAVEDAREDNIKLYFAADDEGKKLAETIASQLNSEVIILDPITSGQDDKEAYINAMQSNINILKEALDK